MNNSSLACANDAGSDQIFKTIAYTAIATMGLVGNGLVLAVFRRHRELRSVVFYFIANMATSDLVLPLFAFPRALVEIYNGPMTWLIDGASGAFFCKMATFLQDISTAVSIQSLLIIAVERFVLLVYPTKSFLKSSWRLKLVLAITWLIAIAFHAPYLTSFQVASFGNKIYCVPEWSEDTATNIVTSKAYFVLIFTSLYAVPFVILVALYTTIVIRLQRYRFKDQNNARKRRIQDRNRTVTVMAMFVVIAFFVCWTPFFVFGFLLCFHWNLRLPCDQINFRFTVLIIAHLNSAVNPGIYMLCSKAFRQGVRACFRRMSSFR
ncbi:neuropeptide Y receptor type 6 [Nematostella vectensis]|uniref:neuropeptide Y receptor type 6 n=1 Tax=Nematostella vectensis TaxID=45351 RepID=UPI00138FCC68|nr:neuropeptide Y receptor type 6 [Nematostella vectensis]